MKDRLIRVGIPLAVGLVTLVPLTKLILRETDPGLESLGFLRGPMHLWFLWYLILFCAVWAAMADLGRLPAIARRVSGWLGSPLAPVVLALLTALLVAAGRQLPVPAEPG